MPGHRKWTTLKGQKRANSSHRSVGGLPPYGRAAVSIRYDRAISDADAEAAQASIRALVLDPPAAVHGRSEMVVAIVTMLESRGHVATDVFENADLIEIVVMPA